ncbi:glycosyltransferase family 4 protein [Patescibacteria group bacterium]|nr:glycosyltransferase family 4 protein [Patescibacteria group bacterium]
MTQTVDSRDPVLGFFHRWIEEFAKRFECVTVIALNVGEYSLPANVEVYSLGKEGGAGRLIRGFTYLSLLYSLRNKYTHVFAHMNPEYVIGGGLVWRFLGKKVALWYVHGAVTWRLHLAAFFANKIVTASKESCRLKSEKVVVVGHGIDTDFFSPKNVPHPPSIVSIGRFSPSKSLELIIDAMKEVASHVPGVTLRIVGAAGTPQERGYAKEVKVRAQAEGVTVDKPVLHADVPTVLHLSDIFFNASKTASLDKAVLEAMSCGVVPVTSNTSFKDMLSPMGLYVPHTSAAFAMRAEEVLGNPGVRQELRVHVREEIVKNHSLPRLMGILQSTYESL